GTSSPPRAAPRLRAMRDPRPGRGRRTSRAVRRWRTRPITAAPARKPPAAAAAACTAGTRAGDEVRESPPPAGRASLTTGPSASTGSALATCSASGSGETATECVASVTSVAASGGSLEGDVIHGSVKRGRDDLERRSAGANQLAALPTQAVSP